MQKPSKVVLPALGWSWADNDTPHHFSAWVLCVNDWKEVVGAGKKTRQPYSVSTLLLQVSKLPDTDHLSLVLGGLVWAQPEPGPTSAEAALHFKKTVIRYALLSWTMCLSRISSPLRNKFPTAEHYMDKHLLTRREADALKVFLVSKMLSFLNCFSL